DIPVGDKGISYDGKIEVFKDGYETRESFIDSVPVQVKGTQVKEFSNGNRSFSLELEHYENYYNGGGVLLLVVEIKETGEAKIFYKHLLPKELEGILRKYSHQKERAVQLRPLNETAIYNVCRKFIEERNNQPKALIESDLGKSSFDSYKFTSLTYNPKKKETSNIFDHHFTVYGVIASKTPGKNPLQVPLDHIMLGGIELEFDEQIVVGNKDYMVSSKFIQEPNKSIRLIEDILLLEYDTDKKKNNLKFKIERFGNLTSQLKVIPFLTSILKGERADFSNGFIQLNGPNEEAVEIIKNLEGLYEFLLELKGVYDYFGIIENIEIGDKRGEFNKSLTRWNIINQAITHNDYSGITIPQPEVPKFLALDIAEKKIVVFYKAVGTKKLVNAFSDDIKPSQFLFNFEKSEEKFEHTPYWLVKSDFLVTAINRNLTYVRESFNDFEPYKDDKIFGVTNEFCLNYLKLYDKLLDVEILDMVEYIYELYKGVPGNVSEIVFINRMQINLRRNRGLNSMETSELIEMKRKHNDNTGIQFCLNVLLG
ncbi:DUF4365 domain-containing protein, partial [Priestia megaterium]|uniref:DUF4365 domain-containing protein n=1 Tax=Priestia megaterium TaxID=1404 RepID=UPI002E221F7B|nr:DUF4365 domain-containing protein [Priestia megaterium]